MDEINYILKSENLNIQLKNQDGIDEVREHIDYYIQHKKNIYNNIPDSGPGISAASAHIAKSIMFFNNKLIKIDKN